MIRTHRGLQAPLDHNAHRPSRAGPWRRVPVFLAICLLCSLAGAARGPVRAATPPLLVNSTFATNRAGVWPVGSFGPASAHVAGGRLIVGVRGAHAYAELPTGVPPVADGTLTATFRAQGQGGWRVGMVGRWSGQPGSANQYSFWIDNQGYIGATRWSQTGKKSSIFELLAGTPNPQRSYQLSLNIAGDKLGFALNGATIFTWIDTAPLPAGAWGVYVESLDPSGTVQGQYARITLGGRPAPAQPALAVWAWGANGRGQLGDGKQAPSAVPLQVGALRGVRAISSRFDHSLALSADGTVWAWGANESGQLGSASGASSGIPVQVSGLRGVTAIAAGSAHSLALEGDGSVWAWGTDSNGELGPGVTGNSAVPVQVRGLSAVTAIAGGDGFSLAVKGDGTVWAWGMDEDGELGNGIAQGSSAPVQVRALGNVQRVVAGISHGLALKGDGTVWAWGADDAGQLGNGATAQDSLPVQVKGLSGVQAMAAGDAFSLALKSDGTVWAWGADDRGQLGIGSTRDSSVPLQVKGLSGVRAIAAGDAVGLALKADGTVWAWGANDSGQLGIGSKADSMRPAQIKALSGVQAIAAGATHCLVVVR